MLDRRGFPTCISFCRHPKQFTCVLSVNILHLKGHTFMQSVLCPGHVCTHELHTFCAAYACTACVCVCVCVWMPVLASQGEWASMDVHMLSSVYPSLQESEQRPTQLYPCLWMCAWWSARALATAKRRMIARGDR
jgi:hypothetical protein